MRPIHSRLALTLWRALLAAGLTLLFLLLLTSGERTPGPARHVALVEARIELRDVPAIVLPAVGPASSQEPQWRV